MFLGILWPVTWQESAGVITKVAVRTCEQNVLVELQNIRKWYPLTSGAFSQTREQVKAVDNVSLSIYRGETLGLVGESGCGKTTLGRVILGLEKPTGGSVAFDGHDLLKLRRQELHHLRREMQVIFQDPYDSLDPRMTIGKIITEPLVIHAIGDRLTRQKREAELLDMVGLSSVYARRYPHEFSGGQRQRIGIARALALRPKFIVCDEPVSALDVSIQSQILNLLSDLKQEFGLTYLFIAHGLAVVKHISDRVAVMYVGKIVELANKGEIYSNPQHPYTKALISTIPIPDPTVHRKRLSLKGEVPSAIHPPSGCRFHPRCSQVQSICKVEEPELVEVGKDHYVACHHKNSS